MRRYGSILHYHWPDPRKHSASMFIAETRDFRLMLLPISESEFETSLQAPITSKAAGNWSPCGDQCPHNPDYPYKHIGELP